MPACSSFSIAGRAVATMVWSTDAMNSPMETIAKISLRRSFCRAPGASRAGSLVLAVSPVRLTCNKVSCLLASIQVESGDVMDTELVARLRAVIPRLARVLNDTSTGEDLTPTQYSVLALVRGRGPLGLTELTELEGINPTMLSRVVKALDERGLIRRMQDPGDLRAARVAVTAEGERVPDRVPQLRPKVLSDCLHGPPADTAATLLAAVPDLEALAEALKPPAKPVKS